MKEHRAIACLKNGDINGLEYLVKTYQVRAVRTAHLIVHDRALAEDIVQSAFIRVYERIDQFDDSRPFGPWFFRIVANDAIKATNRTKRHVSLDREHETTNQTIAETLVDPGPTLIDLIEKVETEEEIWRMLDALSPEQRASIILRYYLGMAVGDIAEELDTPQPTIRWRLHAARKKLRTLLEAADQKKPTDRSGKASIAFKKG